MRSSWQHLNQLLKKQFRDFAVFEPTEPLIPSSELARLQAGILGFLNISNYRFQVVERTVLPRDYRFDDAPAVVLHNRTYRLLNYRLADANQILPRAFCLWTPKTRVTAGDMIAFIKLVEQKSSLFASELIAQE